MATAALPFEVGQRVTVGANTAGVPTGTGTCVGVYNDAAAVDSTIDWVVVVRVADDVRGNHDYHVPSSVVTAA